MMTRVFSLSLLHLPRAARFASSLATCVLLFAPLAATGQPISPPGGRPDRMDGEGAGAYRFNRAAYNPAILSISFTDRRDASDPEADSAFLDIILIPREGEIGGQRVVISRDRFQALLQNLYRQLARQDPLHTDDPSSPARQLYKVLIAPVAPVLRDQSITTLLIAPERGLQAIPFSALHDGEQFLGERFAFSITPSLRRTSLAPPQLGLGSVLLAGASQFSDLAPLPLVPQEIRGIGAGRLASQPFLDRAFTPDVLLNQAADERFQLAHIATHAEFLPGGPGQARIYTGTEPVSMADFLQLRQRRLEKPLELFVLSACRTALGDEDSEMGFAGLALQSGARSAIGTLWYVDDVATSAFFLQFYRFLEAGFPKAEALQATRSAMREGKLRLVGDQVLDVEGKPLLTQLTPIQQRRIRTGMQHPFFWSGITLMGTPW